jgi:hypothetical protein
MLNLSKHSNQSISFYNDSSWSNALYLVPAKINNNNHQTFWRKLVMTLNTFSIDKTLLNKAEKHDTDALFQLGLIHLQHNRAGFARALFQHAAKIGHEVSKKCLAILEDCKISVKDRVETILTNYEL